MEDKTIYITAKRMGRGLYAYLPKKFFSEGEKIAVRRKSDSIDGVVESLQIDMETIKYDLQKSILIELGKELDLKILKRMVEQYQDPLR